MFTIGVGLASALVGLVVYSVRLGNALSLLAALREAHNANTKEHREAREQDRGRIHALELARAGSDVEQANTAKELAKLAAIIDERIPRRRERAE